MYKLMLKDIVVADIELVRTEYELNTKVLKVYKRELIPLSIQSKYYTLMSWIESRYILAYKRETSEFFKSIGIVNIEQFIDITNCTSLNDCYWVKSGHSNKKWKNVSLYRNPFNENVGHYSMFGKILNKNIGSSPDFSTDGNYPKCWKRYNGEIYMLKAGFSFGFNSGLEPFSEVFACQLANYLQFPIIQQSYTVYNGVNVSKSKCICDESKGLIKLSELCNRRSADFKWLLENYNCLRVQQMLMLDYLLCNNDRHFGNIWIYVDNDTNKPIGFTEIGDNNLSCIPYYLENEGLINYINELRAKDGRTWG